MRSQSSHSTNEIEEEMESDLLGARTYSRTTMTEKARSEIAKTKTLWVMLLAMGASQTTYMNICSLLPFFCAEHYPALNGFDIGVLLSIYQITFLITCPIIGEKLSSIGRKNCILWGAFILVLSTLLFGLAALFTDLGTYYVMSMIGRGFQGIGDAMICIAIPSIISIEYPKDSEKY